MHVVIRADASHTIGTGHVMRCLTLADALVNEGATVRFICRAHEGNLVQLIEQKGYEVFLLEALNVTRPGNSDKTDKLFHADWLGDSQLGDAFACKEILSKFNKVDWLIVDHYAIDYRWQQELTSYYKKLFVIDDLADRKHLCNLLLDQTFGREQEDYRSRVPEHCQLLLGSQYALLRPEFSQWRDYSLQRRIKANCETLLISMGGVDPDNVTSKLLQGLIRCSLPKNLHVQVVLGGTAPFLKEINELAQSLPYRVDVLSGVNNMAELMAHVDVCIGAAGATSWERCCLGLPTLMVVLADNQKNIAHNLQSISAVKLLSLDHFERLCELFESLLTDQVSMAFESAKVTDGLGVNRVIESLK
ncbi:UDP-2,4-diacetamido-2,4,6-trideoxy-beta-L-altropyranose hydrolase [Thiomicrorhabdus sp. Kp2]|uniref:UDP-2,4-diacetamido-2,4, 6-trideoxy-beta-L-altropyranose hydrolase n=1 Tax=Thiomicrorhabdus sp. Kp2 TaxID=1123518 RepID=UPI000593B803|nr:UDP-2,4-diacetamido-2,4,6-trideoxy-beta-L-altropyranose hydrolase [Thiomicrorhabdus sp. Kp2]